MTEIGASTGALLGCSTVQCSVEESSVSQKGRAMSTDAQSQNCSRPSGSSPKIFHILVVHSGFGCTVDANTNAASDCAKTPLTSSCQKLVAHGTD